jgi:hypothetical protein
MAVLLADSALTVPAHRPRRLLVGSVVASAASVAVLALPEPLWLLGIAVVMPKWVVPKLVA